MHEGGQWDEEMPPLQELYEDINNAIYEYNYFLVFIAIRLPKVCNVCVFSEYYNFLHFALPGAQQHAKTMQSLGQA